MPTKAEVPGCEECLKTGGRWLYLRVCRTCGKVGCCDSFPNHHASAHAATAGHPILTSIEPGEDWSWCTLDQVAFGPDGQELPFEDETGEGPEVTQIAACRYEKECCNCPQWWWSSPCWLGSSRAWVKSASSSPTSAARG